MNIRSGMVRFREQISLRRPSDAEASNSCRNPALRFSERAEIKAFVPADGGDGRRFSRSVYMEAMMTRVSKAIGAGLVSLAMAATVVLSTAPASAGGFRAGGFHGGGFHGGGWHGGGWGGRGVWHGGYWRGGTWYGGWWGPAVAAGVLTGAAIASYPYWGGGYGDGGYGYGGGCWQVRPTYDGYGNYLGDQSVNVC
jgi:hypothetical protein